MCGVWFGFFFLSFFHSQSNLKSNEYLFEEGVYMVSVFLFINRLLWLIFPFRRSQTQTHTAHISHPLPYICKTGECEYTPKAHTKYAPNISNRKTEWWYKIIMIISNLWILIKWHWYDDRLRYTDFVVSFPPRVPVEPNEFFFFWLDRLLIRNGVFVLVRVDSIIY